MARVLPLPHRRSPSVTSLTAAHALLLTLLVGLLLSVGPAVEPAVAATTPAAAPTVVPLEAWAGDSCPAVDLTETAEVKRLVVHHTHRPVVLREGEVTDVLRRICAGHVERGFSTIGYHYLVDPWGGIHQGRGLEPDASGAAPEVQPIGAHVAGTNAGALGIAFIGDHEEAPPTPAALDAAEALLAWLSASLTIDPTAGVDVVSNGAGSASFTGAFRAPVLAGHGDSNNTACPGEHLVALLPELRDRVAALAAGVPVPSHVAEAGEVEPEAATYASSDPSETAARTAAVVERAPQPNTERDLASEFSVRSALRWFGRALGGGL